MNENDNDTCPSRLPAKPWTVKCACIIADLLCLSVGAIMTPFPSTNKPFSLQTQGRVNG